MKNKGRKLGDCICDNCGVEFKKPQSELNRNQKMGRKNFCSRTCVGKSNFKNLPSNIEKYDISKHCGNKRDDLTKFRYHYRNIKNRDKEIDITIDDLKEIWEKQDGVCPYLGVKLHINSYGKIRKNSTYSASVDRIDSSKGYVKDNIQWISRAINFLKNDMSENELFEIFNLIINKKRVS
jgi:hypothetical protein